MVKNSLDLYDVNGFAAVRQTRASHSQIQDSSKFDDSNHMFPLISGWCCRIDAVTATEATFSEFVRVPQTLMPDRLSNVLALRANVLAFLAVL